MTVPKNSFKLPTDGEFYPIPLGFLDTTGVIVLDGTSGADVTDGDFTEPFTPVLISAEENFHYEKGATPTATTGSTLLLAGYYQDCVRAGEEISIIKAASATAGKVFITPIKGK
jgi:hypothetical protein